MSVIDTVKAHPLISGGVAILAIIIIVVLTSGGSAPTVQTAADTSSTDTGSALQIAQIQATSDANSIQANLQALQITAATTLAGKTIDAQSTDNANYLEYKAHSEDTGAAERVASLTSSLSAQVATRQSADALTATLAGFTNQQSLASIQANQNIQTESILSNTLLTNAQINAKALTDQANIYANTQIANETIASNTQIETAHIASATQIQLSENEAIEQKNQEYFQELTGQQQALVQMNATNHSGGFFGGGGFLGLGI